MVNFRTEFGSFRGSYSDPVKLNPDPYLYRVKYINYTHFDVTINVFK